MLKVIFAIIVFFFFIAVLFYGISFIINSIARLFNNKIHQPQQRIQERNEPKTIPISTNASHQIFFYDPVLDQKIEENGDIVKCYSEHGIVWVKFKPLHSDNTKTIKVSHILSVDNLKTNESKYAPQDIAQYFNRFI